MGGGVVKSAVRRSESIPHGKLRSSGCRGRGTLVPEGTAGRGGVRGKGDDGGGAAGTGGGICVIEKYIDGGKITSGV